MVYPAAQRPRFLAPGDKLGKYDLIRQIAVGGMAELYLARTVGIEGFEKLVVVKRILPQFASNASFVNMFLQEARLAATLHHPNIAQVYDIGQEGTEYFFAMEYIHGEDLGRMVATATDSGVPMSLDVALTLVAGLCAGLHYAHEKVGSDGKPLQVVHRDVSPSNVLVSYDGAVKLVDFGIARAGSQPSTTRGGIKGKIGYMSPEQCRGKETLDRRSDLFSVGAILYEITCGRLPFIDETEYGVLNQIVNTDAPPPSHFVPSYPPALEKIVLKALSRDREQRYATGIQLQGDIEDFAHDNRLRVSPLVLARLMGSLFSERLEEWDSARAQGAFFVEQHVVRTLIESGKTSDGAAAYDSSPKTFVDDDTSVTGAALGDNEPTNIQAPVSEPPRPRTPTPRAQGRSQTVPPPAQPTMPLPLSPVPAMHAQAPVPVTPRAMTPTPPVAHAPTPVPGRMPGAVPIVGPHVAKGGSLVSGAGSYGAPATPIPAPSTAMLAIGDTTERVRVPTPPPIYNSSGGELRAMPARSKLPLVLVAGAAAIGVVIATVIVISGDAPETKAASVPAKVEPAAVVVEEPPPEPPEPAPPKPEPTIVEAKQPEPPPPPPVTRAEPTPKRPVIVKTAPKIRKPAVNPPVVKKDPVVVKKDPPEPKAEPKVEPKEAGKWNADSPFMPVRPPDKKP